MYDVVIVGTGPAGSTAAYRLGQAGAKVLVLEKKQLPRYKPCGGGISPVFLKKEFPFSFDSVIETIPREVFYCFLGTEIGLPIPDGEIAMVMRDRFDRLILEQAGCDVRDHSPVQHVWQENDRVEVETAGGEKIQARFVIGADGANSMVAHSLGLRRRRLIPAVEVEARVPDKVYEYYASGPRFIFEGGPRYGYQWIFPKAGSLSVGIAGQRPKRGQLQRELYKKMAQMGIPLDQSVQYGHSIPLYDRRIPVAAGNILLVGDVVGTADPFTGEGIRPAIKSGRLAAEAILAGQTELYPKRLHEQIGRNNLVSEGVANFFYSLKELCLLFGAPNPITTEAILDMLSDQAGGLQVLVQSILSLPYFLIGEASAGVAGLFGGEQKRSRVEAAFFPRLFRPVIVKVEDQ